MDHMGSVIFEERVTVPLNITTLGEFQAWTHQADFPANGRIDYVQGTIEVDMSPEDLFAHGTLKGKILWISFRMDRARSRHGFWKYSLQTRQQHD